MKIPFTLDAWLKDKSQKIETRSGKNVRIICWDKIGVPIVALVGDAEDIVTYNRDGTIGQQKQMQFPSDLFIITPEPELTEFELAFDLAIADAPWPEKKDEWYPYIKEPELSEFEKKLSDVVGYAISLSVAEPQKPTSEFVKEYSAELFELAKKELKEEALNDLPRWINDGFPEGSAVIDIGGLYGLDFIRRHGRFLRISDIEKLPGFKEGK